MDFDTFLALAQSQALPGVIVALITVVAIYLLKFSDLFNTGALRRVAAVLLPVFLSGVRLGGDSKDSFTALIGILIATLIHTLLDATAKSKLAAKTG